MSANQRTQMCLATIALLFIGLFPQPCASQPAKRIKVAEGEYRLTTDGDLGIGPIETEVFNFHESWSLWRTDDGFEAEGEQSYESPRETFRRRPFWVKLDRNWQVLKIQESAQLRWRRDSGPLTCDLLPREIRCNSGARNPAGAVDIRVAMDLPYGILWPISVFSLGGLTSAVDQPPGGETLVQLISIEELSSALPVLPMRADGRLRFLGWETVTVGTSKIKAKKYELTTAMQPGRLQIWVSPEGLVTAVEKVVQPRSRLELVRLSTTADFSRRPPPE